MNILIVGGSGHVSGTLARLAAAKGHKVWTITRGHRPPVRGVEALIADRHDEADMAALIAQQKVYWDLVVDSIAYDVPDIQQDIRLFRSCARHFVFISTDFVYDPAHRRFPQAEETTHWVTGTEGSLDYGRKKRLCESELINGDTGEMEWTIVRPCHIYGPQSELGCLPLHGRDPGLIEKLIMGEPLHLVGGGHFLQQPICVDDLAETILSAAGRHTAFRRIFNIAGPDIIESRHYYEIIAGILGVPLKIEEVPVNTYKSRHPDMTPFLCHRIYDLETLKTSGLSVPSTPITLGLRLHVEGLLARKARNGKRP